MHSVLHGTKDSQITVFDHLNLQIIAKARWNSKAETLQEQTIINALCSVMKIFHIWSSEAPAIKRDKLRVYRGGLEWTRAGEEPHL